MFRGIAFPRQTIFASLVLFNIVPDLQDIQVQVVAQGVLQITLDRAQARNALRNNTLREISETFRQVEADPDTRCIILYGNQDIFAAGADIKEMADQNLVDVYLSERPKYWKVISETKKPIIAAVNGYALGGGCELVMHADIVIAGRNAQFGQPEINLGIIPGSGGTQRLIRSVGKSVAMKMVLAGEFLSAEEALAHHLVAEVVEPEVTLKRALQLAEKISKKSPLAIRAAKESLLAAFETHLSSGLELERKLFTLLAGSDDRREGITAFLEKRSPNFRGN